MAKHPSGARIPPTAEQLRRWREENDRRRQFEMTPKWHWRRWLLNQKMRRELYFVAAGDYVYYTEKQAARIILEEMFRPIEVNGERL